MRTSIIDWLWRVLAASQHPAQHLVIVLHANEGQVVEYMKKERNSHQRLGESKEQHLFLSLRRCVDCFDVAD